MFSFMTAIGIIGGLLSFFFFASLDGYFQGVGILLTNNFPWHFFIFVPLALLCYISNLGLALVEDIDAEIVHAASGTFVLILLALLITGSLAGIYFQYGDFDNGGGFFDHLMGIFVLPYTPILYLGSPVLVGILLFHAPLIVTGVIGLMTGHPATRIVKRHVAQRRPSAVVAQELSQALQRHDVPDEHLSTLLEELPPWRRFTWTIKARRYAKKSRSLKELAEAERSAQEADTDLAYTVAEVERDRRLRYPDHAPLTPERIRAIAEKMIADDIKAKAYKLTPDDLDYHAKLREQAEEEVANVRGAGR